MLSLPRPASRLALALLVTTSASFAQPTSDLPSELTGNVSNVDTGTQAPSGLPWVEFDFEDKNDRGTFPYEFTVEGTGAVGEPAVPGMAHSGKSCLVYSGDGRAVITFSIPVERLEFYWRDQSELVKSSVTGFGVNQDVVYRADGLPYAWGFYDYHSLTEPIVRLEFTMQSTQEIAVVDDLRILHRETTRNFCAGDGWSEPIGCPCGNLSEQNSLEGCTNSTLRGARMHSLGNVNADVQDLRFLVTNLPSGQPALLFEGEPTDQALPFRDGLLCLGQVTRRLDVGVAAPDGSTTLGAGIFEGPGKPAPGDVRDYQCWYRDPVVSPCGSGSNFSQAMRAEWD